MDEGQSDSVTQLHAGWSIEAQRAIREGKASRQFIPRPEGEEPIAEIIDRVDRVPGQKHVSNEEHQQFIAARTADVGKLFEAQIYDEADALRALQFLLDRVRDEGEERASSRNALEFHLVSQLCSFMRKLSFHPIEDRLAGGKIGL